jgi:thymidine phosphorylase
MLPQEIIRKKRDGPALSAAEISAFVGGIPSKAVSEGQVAAFCMAVLLKKMDMQERVALTSSMARSGTVLAWDLPGPVLDKHSTGGVGDKTSLMLAPVIAACGGFVPMISGRGLGHTGGTLDKMDAIPGYASQPDLALFRKAVKEAGCAVIGATPDLAPADRVMYAVRDVTATVESLDLITASILSKKLAAGLQGLVMDVKFGSGAFMKDYADARELARSIAKVASGAGLPTVSLLTDMDQVLGRTAGNAVEVAEAVACLKNENADSRLHDVTVALTAELLVLGGLARDDVEARHKVKAALDSGQAAERFGRMVAALGGPKDFVEKPEKYLKRAPVARDFHLKGKLAAMDVFRLGIGIVELGGGRARPSDTIDHAVGLTNVARIGEDLSARPLATIHARDEESWKKMADTLAGAVTVSDTPAPTAAPVRERITP